MKNKKFDQELKSELEYYQSSVDPAAIWAAIGDEVDQINEAVEEENKRPVVWIFGLLSVALLMVLAIGWSMKTSQVEQTVVANLNTKIQTTKPLESNTQNLRSIENAQHSAIVEKKNEELILSKKVSNSSAAIISQPFNSEKEGVDNSKKTIKPNLEEKGNLSSPKKDNAKKTFLTPILVIKNEQLLDDFSNGLARIILPEIVATPSLAERRRRRTPAWNVGVEIQGGASLTNRKLSLNNGENQSYLTLRKETESALETIQLGGRFELQHRSGFSISTGIQWARITEKYTLEEKVMEDRLENTLISFSLDMNQDTVNRTYDDIIRTRTTTTTREGFNRYRLLDIPLLIGYHIKNENWSLGFQTGILTNLSLSTKGFIYDENSQLIDINANQQTIYKSSVGIGFYVGLTGRVALTENIQITVNPFYRRNAGSFTLSENLISQKYGWMGMNVGMRYGF